MKKRAAGVDGETLVDVAKMGEGAPLGDNGVYKGINSYTRDRKEGRGGRKEEKEME